MFIHPRGPAARQPHVRATVNRSQEPTAILGRPGGVRDAQRGYAQADPYVKRLLNRTLIERITIKGGQLAGVELQ